MGRLDGRKCLVTGAARGIGYAIAAAFAREGAEVAILDRDASSIAKAASEIAKLGGGGHPFAADVTDDALMAEMIGAVETKLGRIDILVNNAGILTAAPIAEMSVAMWDETMGVNLRSVFVCSRLVLPGMRARKFGRIINMASQLAHKGSASLTHYSAAKAGVIGFTRALSQEVIRDGINVNAICPGPIDTDMTRLGTTEEWRTAKVRELPIGRFGRVEEIAPSAVMLASDEGSYYVGATLNPNGGDVMI
ncbi:3-oxoacyl-ACP reductase family protein [Aminobacter sp. MSH1]|uniref:SDR family NAD(P)-dependent oxidoreductase n=1 Tax=Aminobacter sp. MSH1 TaxID=374606 RepID=UPI000D3B77F8|nr:3-oxoacyl-ACP reductase family protein [Aminobacter sp. MSH1]